MAPPQLATRDLQIFSNTSTISSNLSTVETYANNINTYLKYLRTFKKKLYASKALSSSEATSQLRFLLTIKDDQVKPIIEALNNVIRQATQIKRKAGEGTNAANKAQEIINRATELRNTYISLRDQLKSTLAACGFKIVQPSKTNPNGLATVDGSPSVPSNRLLAPVTNSIRLISTNVQRTGQIINELNSQLVELQTVQTAKVKIFTKPNGTITLIASVDGKPLNDADIRLLYRGNESISNRILTQKLENGRITLNLSPPGQWTVTRVGNYNIHGGVSFTAPNPMALVQAPSSNKVAKIVLLTSRPNLKRNNEITVRLMGPSDRWIKQTPLHVIGPDGKEITTYIRQVTRDHRFNNIPSTTTDQYGQISFTATLPGAYKVVPVKYPGKAIAVNITDAPTIASTNPHIRTAIPTGRVEYAGRRGTGVTGVGTVNVRNTRTSTITTSNVANISLSYVLIGGDIKILSNSPNSDLVIYAPDRSIISGKTDKHGTFVFSPKQARGSYLAGSYEVQSVGGTRVKLSVKVPRADVIASYRQKPDGSIVLQFRRPTAQWAEDQQPPQTIEPGSKVVIVAPDGTRIERRTDTSGRIAFTPVPTSDRGYLGGIYRIKYLQGHTVNNYVMVPTQEQLAERRKEENAPQLAFEQNNFITDLKKQKMILLSKYSNNPTALRLIDSIYSYYVRHVGQITTITEVRKLSDSLPQISALASQITEKHLAARTAIANSFGADTNRGSRYWQLLGTPNSGLQAVFYRVLKSGDVGSYDKFMHFVQTYASASQTLAQKRTALLSSPEGRLRYGVLQDRLAATYKNALRDIARYDTRELSRLDNEIRRISV